MDQAIWVLVNCHSIREAKFIGRQILKKRLCSCFDIVPRHSAFYYWPPKSGNIETSRGATLIIETFKDKYDSVAETAKRLHSDQLPFVGFVKIEGLSKDYVNWMKGELVEN